MNDDDMVQTTRGLLPRSQLDYRTMQQENEHAVSIVCEWYDKTDGVLVRRDGFVNVKQGHAVNTRKGGF